MIRKINEPNNKSQVEIECCFWKNKQWNGNREGEPAEN